MGFGSGLGGILEKQLRIFEELEQMTYEKTDIIIDNDIVALEELTKNEEKLINKLGLLEAERLKLMENLGLDEDISMSWIIERVSEGKERLIELKDGMTEITGRIHERNAINSELIEDNLQWLDFNMNLISNAQTPATYGKGKENKGVGDSLFDRKV